MTFEAFIKCVSGFEIEFQYLSLLYSQGINCKATKYIFTFIIINFIIKFLCLWHIIDQRELYAANDDRQVADKRSYQ